MKYIPYVNIKMGTKSVMRFSNGNTLPLTQLPFGMSSFCLQTDGSTPWFFNPEHPFSEGVRLTHQPCPWINEYGSFLMIPQNDIIRDEPHYVWSGYRIDQAIMRPDYLNVTFLRSNCKFELTPTERCAAIRLTFMDERKSYLSFLPTKGNYQYKFDKDSDILIGSTDGHSMDASTNFKMYFVVKFLDDCINSDENYCGKNEAQTFHVSLNKNICEARIGISYISEEMALLAIERECSDKTFDELKNEAEAIWEEKLHRIEIESDDEKQLKTFYSCLYRTFLYPHKAYEIDENGNNVHYAPYDGLTYPGVRYTDNGFWDTVRTVYPLFTMIAREEFAEMLEGFVNDYRECGWLPRWLSIGEVGCMPSTLIDGVIAEAAANGIGSREVLEDALKGMIHHATHESSDPRFGRSGCLSYQKYGYVPRDEFRESVNLTLDAAYGDWCIARVAKILGHDDIVEEYMLRSKNYKNIFDTQTGFMRGKDKNGEMADNFDPCIWGGEYTEGSAWQNSFFVPHDVKGLAELYGGKEKLLAKLDELFATEPKYRVMGYGFEIHEMTEMASVDFGQMAISNQPSFHIPFLYSKLGQPEKTCFWVEKLVKEAFSPENDGYPGDEDNGTTSAWYILATIGQYRLCPGELEWIPCKRLVKSVKINGQKV